MLNLPEKLAKSGYSWNILQDSVAKLCIFLRDCLEKPKTPRWSFSGEGTTKRKRQSLTTKIAREKDQHKIVVLSSAGKKGNARVHNEAIFTTRSNGGHLDCSKTKVAANDKSFWPNQRSEVRPEGAASSLISNAEVRYQSHCSLVVNCLSDSWSLSLLQKKKKWATLNQHKIKTKSQQ